MCACVYFEVKSSSKLPTDKKKLEEKFLVEKNIKIVNCIVSKTVNKLLFILLLLLLYLKEKGARGI